MAPSLHWLEDPTVFQVNRINAHSDHVCFPSADEITSGTTSLRQSLDGQWKFCWSSCPAQRPADFWKMGYSLDTFGTIQVPGHMETQGFDRIQYINKLYPWDGHRWVCPSLGWTYPPAPASDRLGL